MDLGFIGLGNMGGPMALNLMKAGHKLYVYDLSPEAVQRVVEAGAVAMDGPSAVARASEVVLTSLPTPVAVEAVYLGEKGLLEGARSGQLFVDLSSISPSLAKKMAARFGEKGATVLDAPVSGGVKGAAAATLAIMVGGDVEGYRRAEPILKSIGTNVFHMGPVGSSSTMKMMNQLLVGVSNAAVCEMANLARKAGMDLAQVKEVISASSGMSRIFEGAFPKAAERDFAPGFAVDLMAKDLRLIRDLAAELETELVIAPAALSVFERASQAGYGKDDVTAALQVYEGK